MSAVIVRRFFAGASRRELFDAWLDPVGLSEWMRPANVLRCDATIDPCVGGAFRLQMETAGGVRLHAGTYQRIDRPNLLVFSWTSPVTGQGETLVSVAFRDVEGGAEIELVHQSLSPLSADRFAEGWRDVLRGLSAHLEGVACGIDHREY